MHVGFLGPLFVRVDGRDVTPAGQRLRDVLTVLLLRRGRPVPVGVVLDLVWGNQAQALTGTAVHTVVARLRRLLGARAIQTREVGYLVDPSTTTDEDAFTDAVRQAARLGDRGDWVEAVAAYRDALAHWRGATAFDGVSEELVGADRVRLADLRDSVTDALVSALLDHPEAAEPGEPLRLATESMAAQPLRERPYQLGMLAAYRSHRQADALEIFGRLAERLRAELGIDPSPSTVQLHTQILRQDTSLTLAAPPQRSAGSVRVRATRPPSPVTSLIGRETELAAIASAPAGGRRLITLVGPAGVGKSRLLMEVAARHADVDQIVYADMSGLDGVDVDRLAEALALEHGVSLARLAPLDALIRAFTPGEWLLLIDEAEWASDAVATLAVQILERCPGVQFMVASRRPLDVRGEFLVPVEPLGCPAPGANTEVTMAAPAVRLLLARLADRAVRFDTDTATATLLGEIARRVDGLPLAVELLAGRATTSSLAELATLANAPLDLAVTQPGNRERHRSLRDAVAWSTNRLDADHLLLLRRLAVFAGAFAIPAATTVVGSLRSDSGPGPDAGAVVRELARQSLVQVDRSDPVTLEFRLLRPVRDLVLEGVPTDELVGARARHRRWHANRWRGHRRRDDLLADVRGHLDDYLEALRSALEAGDSASATDLIGTLTELWRFAGASGPGLRWTGRALDSGTLVPADRARVQTFRAILALRHQPGLVLADTAAAIPVLDAIPDPGFLVNACLARALELHAAGRIEESIAHVDRAVAIALTDPADNPAVPLSVQAYVHATSGDPSIAATAIEDAAVMLEASGSTSERITVCGNVAVALLGLDRPRDALELLDRVAPEIPRVLAATPDFFSMDVGWAALGCGEPVRALAAFGALLATGPPPVDRQTAETLLGMACALAAHGDPFAADGLAGALDLAASVGLTLTPSLRRVAAAARQQAGAGVFRRAMGEPIDGYTGRLARSLREAAESLSVA